MTESTAPWTHIEFCPVDAWVEIETRSASVAGKSGDHVTYLAWVRQVNAEMGKSFHATSVRLETAVAVQHQSQWKLDLDPRFQRLSLHWLRVVRAGQSIDHLQRDRMRLVQRHLQLENHVIDGSWTLLVVLDDVRPGDIIEAGYTYTKRHPIRPQGCEEFFVVPPALIVGRYLFSVIFDPKRCPLSWKASEDAAVREEFVGAEGLVRWKWSDSQLSLREPEPNQPSTCLDYIWVQVSDLGQWGELSALVAKAWAEKGGGPLNETTIASYPRPAQVDSAAVVSLVRRIQDEFRYLSVELEVGGWIPADSSVVAHRRYGDCKDLAWLAVAILRAWGLAARPILVGTGLLSRVSSLLPSALAFNHALLEVTVNDQTRWFDLTLRSQGGDYTSMPVGIYGFGLAVDSAAAELIPQPGTPVRSVYSIRETLLIDTHKNKSTWVERRVRGEGWQAEFLRAELLAQGLDNFSKERLAQVQRRFGKARAAAKIQTRDDRQANVCELIEEFEVDDLLFAGVGDNRAQMDVPPNYITQGFAIPDAKPRRTPWHMPFPFEMRHQITVRHSTMGSGKTLRRTWGTPSFSGFLEEPRENGAWTKTAWFIVQRGEIPPGELPAYREALEDFFTATSWRLYLPWNSERPARPERMGQFASPAGNEDDYVPGAVKENFAPAAEVVEGARTTSSNWVQRFIAFHGQQSLPARWLIWIAAWFAISALVRVFQ